MKIVIPGGSGQVGMVLAKAFSADGHEVVILSRKAEKSGFRTVKWDAETLGDWADEFESADVIINLAGRNVNCRYNPRNRRQMMDSRVNSTVVVGKAIENAANPPGIWIQASTATIYAHRFDSANDEFTGIIGGGEPGAPDTWNFSIEIAKAWEKAAEEANTPKTRKILLRSAVTMSPDKDGIFDVMLSLVKKGLGGTAGSGRQYISWIHEADFIKAVNWLIDRAEFSGAVNVSSPNPLPNKEFMKIFRDAWGTKIGLPATELMLGVGAFFMRTETELILKSRRVVPARLIESGFEFEFPDWKNAARDLCKRSGEL